MSSANTGTVTTTTHACYIPEIWSPELNEAVEANCVLPKLVKRVPTDKGYGDTVNIGELSNPTVATKTANAAVTFYSINEGSLNLTITVHRCVSFLVEDIVKIQSAIDVRSNYTRKAGYALASDMEGYTASVGLNSLAESFSQAVGTLGVELTKEDMIQAWLYLETANAPQEDRFIYISPAGLAGLFKIDEFIRKDYGADGTALTKAKMGQLLGADVYTSTLTHPAAANQSDSWFCQRNGVLLAIQSPMTTHGDYLLQYIGWGVVCDQIYGFKENLIPPETAGGGTGVDTHNVHLHTVA